MTKTRTGSLMGTPLYVAPEQARGYEIDARVDIYSLGAVAFEMVTGRPPFVADNAMDVVAMHLHDDPPRASSAVAGVPRALDDLLLATLAKEPDGRPTLAQFRAVLTEVRTAPELGLVAAPTVARGGSGRRATWLALMVAIGGGVAVYATRGGDSEPAAPVPQPTMATEATVAIGPAAVESTPTAPATVPPTAATAATGGPATLALRVSVRGAAVELDGRTLALADGVAVVTVAPGAHRMRVTAVGYHDKIVELRVAAGERLELAPQLDRKRRPGGTVRPPTGGGSGGSGGSGSAAPPPDDDAVVNPFPRPK